MEITRRNLFKGGAAAGIAVAGGLALAGCGFPQPVESNKGAAGNVGENPVSPHRWEAKPDPIAEEEIIETVDADIVVIGAGTAGCVAAHSAAEAGANVVLLEKTDSISARGHDVGCIGSKLHRDAGVEMDIGEMREFYAQVTSSKTDLNLFNIWAYNSGEVMDYYIDEMAKHDVPCYLVDVAEEVYTSPNACTREYQTAIDFGEKGKGQKTEDGEYLNHRFVRIVSEMAAEEGADIRFNTAAQQLIREDGGPVTGVIATDPDGKYVRFNASKGVILATGGITEDKDMLAMWAPLALHCNQILFPDTGGNVGDGLCMGMWAGAGHQKGNAAIMGLPSGAAIGGYLSSGDKKWERLGWLNVNLNGERYTNEKCSGPRGVFAALQQPECTCYSIYDADFEAKVAQQNPKVKLGDTIEADIQKSMDEKTLYRADSLEELAQAIGCPADNLKATVARYNELCAAGVDKDFSKAANCLTTVETAPFYASLVKCAVLVVIYGLNVDSHARVCTEDDKPIEGLYAIGNAMGNMITDSYPYLVPGISHGRCITFGRKLAQALVKGEMLSA
ncbi:FAD-dependent oxidoreductase [Slackia isoflavoniconvertens]|uniref:FAD-dependent oxidoreductase n=1 Tax=Slackia isoflavoniconvertens TaxID=572010 RepID=UPI003076AAF9